MANIYTYTFDPPRGGIYPIFIGARNDSRLQYESHRRVRAPTIYTYIAYQPQSQLAAIYISELVVRPLNEKSKFHRCVCPRPPDAIYTCADVPELPHQYSTALPLLGRKVTNCRLECANITFRRIWAKVTCR